MSFTLSGGNPRTASLDTLIIPVAQSTKVPARIRDIDGTKLLYSTSEFTGKEGQTAVLYGALGIKAKRMVLIGVGEAKAVSPDTWRRCLGRLSRHAAITASTSLGVDLSEATTPENIQAAIEGYLLGSYKLTAFRTGEAATPPHRVDKAMLFVDKVSASLKAAVDRGLIYAEAQNTARELAETPSADLTPKIYAQRVTKLGKAHGFTVKVLDEKAIARERMGGILGVAQGSAEPPRVVVMQHRGGKPKDKPLVLIGKGVTFDTGGISLKPALNMHEMKQDMSGSAAVVGAMTAIARLKLPRNVIGIIGTTENAPSGTAYKPGDVLRMRSGKTVEIINTDAEGRLVLADCLDYADGFAPQAVIDIATLTGAAKFILGTSGAPIIGTHSRLMDQIRDAADRTSERVWELPLWDDFVKAMDGTVADLVNSASGGFAGTCTAAGFLSNFVKDWPWAHIDIAYMDMAFSDKPYQLKGGTGFGARLLADLAQHWSTVK